MFWYYPLYFVLCLISLLPFTILYLISDLICFLLRNVFHYREKVIDENLSLSFPVWSAEKRKEVRDAYYRNLADNIVETIKLISVSKQTLSKRITCNWDLFDSLGASDRNGIGYLSHQFNWEWGTVVSNWYLPKRFTGVYLPLTNPVFDRLFYKIRSRSGTQLIKVQEMQLKSSQVQKEKIIWGFIADQNPSDPKRVSWNDFMHRKTAFSKGPELIARRYDNVVYFAEIVRLKRGYYRINAKLAFEYPRETREGEITEAYVRFLEDSIKRQPENWVWSHRRWKHLYRPVSSIEESNFTDQIN